MASNQAIDLSGSLPQMKPLSPNTFLYEPPSASPDPNSPKLVALFSWMSAQDVHIAKYTSRYMALYPTARILLVKCPFIHTLSPRISKREIRPAVSVVRALADATPRTETRPQLLLHVFSNGGATNLAKFYDLYSEAESRAGGKLQLPPHVTVYDSCPGGFHWMRSYRALSAAFPRLLAPFVHVFIGWFWLLQVPFGRTGFFGRMWAALKQKALLQSEQRRVYLYSREDEMIYWGDVEKHANESKEVGFKVSRERFEGSKHVAHARLDGDRYWGAVKGLWDGQMEGKAETSKAKVDVKPEEVKPEEVKSEAKAEVKSEIETVAGTDAELPTAKDSEVTSGFEIVEKPQVPKQTEEVKHPEVVMNGAAAEERRQPVTEPETAKEPEAPKQPEVVTPEVVAPEPLKPEAVRPEPVRRKKAPTPPPTIQ